MVENEIQNRNGIIVSPDVISEANKYHIYEEDYTQNPNNGVFAWDKDCDIGEYLKQCTCMKIIVGKLIDFRYPSTLHQSTQQTKGIIDFY